MTWGVHITLAPTWFDPAETPGIITPFMIMYAIHDAMVKPMPGNPMAPSLAESWTVSKDGLVYEFVLRTGAKFHTGDPVTSEDVKFSFERYRGTSHQTFKDKVAAVETPDPAHMRFRLKQPWPDFLTFYSSATGAGWIVPKKYVEKVGEEGFKKAPMGAGPYKFVSSTPGVELVLEAFDAVLAQDAEREAAGLQGHSRRVDAAGRAHPRRGRRRLFDPRRAGRGAPADAGAHAEADGDPGDAVDRHAGPVGPEVAVARPARAPGRQLRHRPQRHQPGDHARVTRSSSGASSPAASTSIGSRQPIRSIRRAPSSCWRRRVPERLRRRRLLL